MKKIILILTVFLLLIGCQKKMTSKQVVENYFNYINEKNEEGFNNLFAVPLKPEDTETLFKGIKEIKIREIHVVEKDEHLMEKEEKEDEITYYVDFDLIYNENNEGITYNDGGNTRNFYLKKVKGEWKIISIGLL